MIFAADTSAMFRSQKACGAERSIAKHDASTMVMEAGDNS